jgi:hypothetical protein
MDWAGSLKGKVSPATKRFSLLATEMCAEQGDDLSPKTWTGLYEF